MGDGVFDSTKLCGVLLERKDSSRCGGWSSEEEEGECRRWKEAKGWVWSLDRGRWPKSDRTGRGVPRAVDHEITMGGKGLKGVHREPTRSAAAAARSAALIFSLPRPLVLGGDMRRSCWSVEDTSSNRKRGCKSEADFQKSERTG